MSPGNFKPKIEMGIVTKDMLQALADLGYPKEFRDKIDLNQATTIIEKQIRFSTENKVSGATNPDKEVVAEEKEGGYKIPEYIGSEKFKAAYNLDLNKLRELVKDSDGINLKENGDTLLHTVVTMAFQDFDKAKEVIEFLKSKMANIFTVNNENLNPIQIAENRSTANTKYKEIVGVLKS